MPKVEQLPTHITRAVLRAPDTNPKTGEVHGKEIILTVRPGWSKSGPYQRALPGGKIEIDDFIDIVETDALNIPTFVLSLEQMIQAGLRAAEREILEELGITLIAGLLVFVDESTNKAGWTTYSFAADLTEKPTLVVRPDSAGIVWIDEKKIVNGKPKMLQGHLSISRRAIKKLNGKNS